MNNKKPLLIIIAVFVALMVGATVLYNNLGKDLAPEQLATQPPQTTEAVPVSSEASGETQPEPQQLPDFTVYDLDGNPVNLSDYFGKPIVLNFWASWCGPCRSEMPEFNEAYLDLGEDIQFLMVNMTDGARETVEIASEFIAGQEYAFPVFYDTDQDAAITYGVYSLPTTLFIDEGGYLVAYAPGAIGSEDLMRGIDMIR